MATLSRTTRKTPSGRVYGWLARLSVTNVTAHTCRVVDSRPSYGGVLEASYSEGGAVSTRHVDWQACQR